MNLYPMRFGPLYGMRIHTRACLPLEPLLLPVDTCKKVDSEYPIFYADFSYRGEADSYIRNVNSS